MGCHLSIGIKGDQSHPNPSPSVRPITVHKDQATSPIHNKKDSSTSPISKIRLLDVEKDINTDKLYDINGTESKHNDSKNRFKNKARLVNSWK